MPNRGATEDDSTSWLGFPTDKLKKFQVGKSPHVPLSPFAKKILRTTQVVKQRLEENQEQIRLIKRLQAKAEATKENIQKLEEICR